MKRIFVATISLCLMLGLAFGAVPVEASPATIVVPDDQPTIQQAIDAASSGDTVYVRSGTYYEHVTIAKPLILLGEDRETTVIDGGGTGTVVYLSHADYVEISGFTVTKGGLYAHGIYLWYSDHNKLTDLNVHSNGRHGILTEHSEYVFIANVNTYSNGWHGIRLGWYPNHSVITNCNASFNDLCGIHPSDWPTNVTITNCTASWNGWDGIWLGWTTDGLIKNCTAEDNGRYGILLDTDRYCTVADCYVGSNPEGIRVYIHSSYYIHNTITNCDVESNDRGIIVCHRGGHGIWYLDTTIKNCDICNNEYGIGVAGKGNKIYHNNLIDNTVQASDNGVDNVWDDGYPSGGNYWRDYAGVDDYSGPGQNLPGSDGIGDMPYAFTGNQDNYPLMEPWNGVPVDIKPTSCPNPLNVKSKGVLPVAILGTDSFDATQVDPSTITLQGVAPIRWAIADVAAPYSPYIGKESCQNCTTAGPDGYSDLTLKFDTQAIVEALGEVEDGDCVKLTITGQLKEEFGGSPIIGEDVVWIVKKG